MTKKVNWKYLPTTISVWVETIEELPEGVYACPQCKGTGRIQVGHADPGSNPTVKCDMCSGTQKIKKCVECGTNPVPSNDNSGLCKDCEIDRIDHVLELEKRPEIICKFPNEEGICANYVVQECNSDGKLVCDPKECEYAIIQL